MSTDVFDFTLSLGFGTDFYEDMKKVEHKYWDYLDHYSRETNPFLKQSTFLEKILTFNGNPCYYDTVRQYWRKYEKYKRTIPTSGIIIKSDDYILVVQVYASEIYGMPKGKHEPEEDSLTAALREVKEETGITFTRDDLENPDSPVLINRTFFYLAHRPERQVSFSNYNNNEIIDIKWVNIRTLEPRLYSKQVSAVAHYLLTGEVPV